MSQSIGSMSQPGNWEELFFLCRFETAKPQEEDWHEPYESRGSRTDVCPAKAGVFSRRQSCHGKSQKPCS